MDNGKSCKTCVHNGAGWRSRYGMYSHDPAEIKRYGLERDQVEREGLCGIMDKADGTACEHYEAA